MLVPWRAREEHTKEQRSGVVTEQKSAASVASDGEVSGVTGVAKSCCWKGIAQSLQAGQRALSTVELQSGGHRHHTASVTVRCHKVKLCIRP